MNDLISRQAAIDKLKREEKIFYSPTGLRYLIGAIRDLPSAQPEQPSEIQDILDYLDTALHPIISPEHWSVYSELHDMISTLPSAQPKRTIKRTETHACDCISRQAAIDAILAVTGNSSVRELYEHVQEHGLSDMWSGGVNAAIDIIIAVPSAQPEIIRCKDCKYAEVADPEDSQDGYTCQFHRGSIWFSGSYCSWAERRIG